MLEGLNSFQKLIFNQKSAPEARGTPLVTPLPIIANEKQNPFSFWVLGSVFRIFPTSLLSTKHVHVSFLIIVSKLELCNGRRFRGQAPGNT